jgi:hypothetical protein
MNWHTKYFRSLDEVEYVFGRTLYGEQELMILEYLKFGIRPKNGGCWTCDAGTMRKLTGKIDQFEREVESGETQWPWSSIQQPLSGLTRVGQPASQSTLLKAGINPPS